MMANWRYKIDLNGVLSRTAEEHDLSMVEKPCPLPVREAIAQEIAKARPLSRFAPQVLKSESIAEVNRVLERIYDEADRSLVWCGLG